MNISNNKSLYPEPTHKKYGIMDYAKQFWINNHNGIVLLTIAVMLIILLGMIGYAAGTGHIHFISTEANNYEHLTQIVTDGGY